MSEPTIDDVEEYEPESATEPEEFSAEPESEGLSSEADPADVRDQRLEIPELDEDDFERHEEDSKDTGI